MNSLNQRDLELHVPIVGWLLIAEHAILLLVGLMAFLFMAGIGVATGDQTAAMILGIVGTTGGSLMVLLAIPGLAAGFGLLQRRSWARMLALVIGVLGLVNFPTGTLLGIYIAWVLMQNAATEYFASSASA